MVLLQTGVLSSRWSFVVLSAVLCALAGWVRVRQNHLSVPIILKNEIQNRQKRALQFSHHPLEVLTKGHKQFEGQIWGMETNAGVRLILPLQYLDELKSHPALSFAELINHDALLQWTGVGGVSNGPLHLFKSKFNPSISAYIPILQQIIQQELPSLLPVASSWTETTIYNKMLRLVSVISTRAFYGSAASQDETWLQLAQEYVSTVLDFLQELKQWPAVTWPFVRFFLPHRRRLLQQWNQARMHLSETLKAKAQGRPMDDPPSLFDHVVDSQAVDLDSLIQTQMALVVAGMHTTAAALTQVIYDIAVHPESVTELREEIIGVAASVGGLWTKKSLGELKKMDSWMKESQRLSPADLMTFQREATEPLTLKNGLYVPKSTKMAVATAAIHEDETYFKNANTFDGLRYYRMRNDQQEPSKHQYISTGKSDLSWGYGRHACPGRFFADVEIKMVLAEFLLRSNVRNPEGQLRHKNIEFEANVMPDETKTVLLQSANQTVLSV